MTAKFVAGVFGVAFGFVMAWARLSDPVVIRRMLMLREPDVFLLMGSAIVVAAIGLRVLRTAGAYAFVTRERIKWSGAPPRMHHVVGSVIFGTGWSVAGTCPGPLAVMIGEGHLIGLVVALGVIAGVVLRGATERARTSAATTTPMSTAVAV